MKNIKKTVVIVLSVLLLLVSCATAGLGYDQIVASLAGYKIIMPSGSNTLVSKSASAISQSIVYEVDGTVKRATVSVDSKSPVENEILFGFTNRPESTACAEGLGPMDYTIQIMNGKIVIVGGSSSANAAAAHCFVELLQNGSFNSLKKFSYTYRFFDTHTSDPYCDVNSAESKALVASWLEKFTKPAWGGIDRDLKESLYALTHKYSATQGRTSTFAHRGDMANYPENSLAGITSSIMCGADTVEFDVRYTKDYIPVVFHDETLLRMTNWREMNGTNGLPTSEFIKDWTFDELMQLSLLDYNGNVTSYKIATVYDALILTSGRIQVSFDDKATYGVGLDDEFIYFAVDADACTSLILTNYRKLKNFDLVAPYLDAELLSFIKTKCTTFTGSYAFYTDASYFTSVFNSDYLSLEEDGSTWGYFMDELGKRYISTNQCYKLSLYMAERGMKAWKY